MSTQTLQQLIWLARSATISSSCDERPLVSEQVCRAFMASMNPGTLITTFVNRAFGLFMLLLLLPTRRTARSKPDTVESRNQKAEIRSEQPGLAFCAMLPSAF
jgi:hypothetical protein